MNGDTQVIMPARRTRQRSMSRSREALKELKKKVDITKTKYEVIIHDADYDREWLYCYSADPKIINKNAQYCVHLLGAPYRGNIINNHVI